MIRATARAVVSVVVEVVVAGVADDHASTAVKRVTSPVNAPRVNQAAAVVVVVAVVDAVVQKGTVDASIAAMPITSAATGPSPDKITLPTENPTNAVVKVTLVVTALSRNRGANGKRLKHKAVDTKNQFACRKPPITSDPIHLFPFSLHANIQM